MQARRDDDLKDSFYLYIMRNSIGTGLRSQYAPNGHMPERLTKLLHELEEDRGAEKTAAKRSTEENHDAEDGPATQPARKQPRRK